MFRKLLENCDAARTRWTADVANVEKHLGTAAEHVLQAHCEDSVAADRPADAVSLGYRLPSREAIPAGPFASSRYLFKAGAAASR
jgi:hypothetical protein